MDACDAGVPRPTRVLRSCPLDVSNQHGDAGMAQAAASMLFLAR